MRAPVSRMSRRLGALASRMGVWLVILVVCLIVQAMLVEMGLRVFGVGETTRFLLRKELDGQAWHVPNRAFYQQFTTLPLDRIMTWDDLEFHVPVQKHPGGFRIFVFGSSAIYGTRTSARILEVMLRHARPDIKWEVYNAACPGMNSHVMRAAARACRSLEPDLYLVYMGNNEAVGPFGPTTTLGQSRLLWRPSVINGLIALNNLRMTQVVRGARATSSLNLPGPDALMGMLPGMTDHYRALLYYRHNVKDIHRFARDAGAVSVLCTLSGNKRYMGVVSPDEPTFNGLHINGILRALAVELPDVVLADVDTRVNAHSEDGLPGYDYFSDNVHFNFDGNYLAATEMYEAMAGIMEGLSDTPLLSRDACAKRLAWTAAAEFELLRWQAQAFHDPYSGERIRRRRAELEETLDGRWRQILADDHEHALEYASEDLFLRHGAFQLRLELGDLDAAREHVCLLGDNHPGARVTLRSRGRLAEAAGEVEAAIAAYQTCLELYPDDPDALRRLGELLFNRGDAEDAAQLYRRFLRVDATDTFVWCRLGQIEALRGRKRVARDIWLRMMKEHPRHPLAHRLLDEAMADTVSLDERTQFWNARISEWPVAAEPKVRLALIHAEQGQDEQAFFLLLEAFSLGADDPLIQFHLGDVARRLSRWDIAEHALRQAVESNPGDGRNWMALIETLRDKGDLHAAKEVLERSRGHGIALPLELSASLDDEHYPGVVPDSAQEEKRLGTDSL